MADPSETTQISREPAAEDAEELLGRRALARIAAGWSPGRGARAAPRGGQPSRRERGASRLGRGPPRRPRESRPGSAPSTRRDREGSPSRGSCSRSSSWSPSQSLAAVAGLDAPVIAGVMVVAWLLVAGRRVGRPLATQLRERALVYGGYGLRRPNCRTTRHGSPRSRRGTAFDPASRPIARRHACRHRSRSSRAPAPPRPTPRRVLFPTATFAIFFLLVLPLSWLLQPPPRALEAVHHRGELRLLRAPGTGVSASSRGSRSSGTRFSRSRSTGARTPGRAGGSSSRRSSETSGSWATSSTTTSSSRRRTTSSHWAASTSRSRRGRSSCRSGSPSSRSWRSATSSTSIGVDFEPVGIGTSRRTSPSSRTWSQAPSCGRAS